MTGKYDNLTQAQLIELLEKRDRTKKLGLVWERDEIAADAAVDENFVACEIVPELSDKAAPWGNLVIEGDNFDALRWLRMTYSGAVKCIYIDPPYNTGNKDWVYNDDYVDKEDRYRHSTWLEFLYRRLNLARDLLAEDGVLLVSINDDQRAKLEMLMDEALPGMRLGSFVWRTRTGGNDAKGSFLSDNHEHVLVYGKPSFRFSGLEKTFEMYRFWDKEKQDFYRFDNITQPKDYRERPNGFYAMYDPETDTYYAPNPQRVWPSPFPKGGKREEAEPRNCMWVFPPDEASRDIVPPGDQIGKWIKQGRIRFPDSQRVAVWNSLEELLAAIDAGEVPIAKKTKKIWREMPFLDFWVGKRVGFGVPEWVRYKGDLKNATQPVSSWIVAQSERDTIPTGSGFDSNSHLVSATNQEGTTEVQDIFGAKAFNYAKPVSLIREMVRQATGHNDLVLDFFAGSATTAQAVMELNAEDGMDRRFIMVSSTEATKDDPSKNLCRDVTAERIRRLNASTDPKYDALVAGFAYLRTKEIRFEDLDYDLTPADAWTALEALHGLPLTLHDPSRSWNVHETDATTLVLVDQFDPALIHWLKPQGRKNLFVYAWAPGQIVAALEGMEIDILPVRDTLVRKFQQ